jgi:hypothetical protein
MPNPEYLKNKNQHITMCKKRTTSHWIDLALGLICIASTLYAIFSVSLSFKP